MEFVNFLDDKNKEELENLKQVLKTIKKRKEI